MSYKSHLLMRWLIAPLFLALVAVSWASAEAIFQDNFDSYTAGAFPSSGGWQMRFSGYGASYQIIDNTQSVSCQNSFKLEGACGWAAEAYHALPSVPAMLRLEVKVKLDSLEPPCANYQDAIIAFQNNAQYATTYYGIGFGSNGMVGPLHYNYNQWFSVRIDMNTIDQTYSVWVDCQPVIVNLSFAGQPLPDVVSLTSHNSRHTRTWYDDLVVTEITPSFADNFDGYTAGTFPSGGGWNMRFSGYGASYQVIDNSQSVSSPNSFKLEGACNWASEVYHSIPIVTAKMKLEGRIKIDSLEPPCAQYQDAIISFQNTANYASTYYGLHFMYNKTVGTGTFEYNRWYKVRIDIDTVAKIYSGWLDMQLVVDNQPFTGPIPDAVSLTSHNSRHTRTWYDDIVVTNDTCTSPTLVSSGPFCDSFEDGDAWQTRWSVYQGYQTLVDSPIHSGQGALEFHGGCHSSIYRTDFAASQGEYTVWVNQLHGIAHFSVYIQFKQGCDPDPNPVLQTNYEFGLSAQNSSGGLMFVNHNSNGVQTLLGSGTPTFLLGEWIQVFIRRGEGGMIVAGYQRPNGDRDSIICYDPNPIIEPGKFLLWACSDVPPYTYFDDVCFNDTAQVFAGRISIPAVTTCLSRAQVPVYATADNPLCGFQLPLAWEGSLKLDTVIFAGTDVAGWGLPVVVIDSANKRVAIGNGIGVSGTPLVPGDSQLVAILKFSNPAGCQPTETFTLNFDTSAIGLVSPLFIGCESPAGDEYVPQVAFDPVTVKGYMAGDATGNCAINIGDAIYIINYVFRGGQAPIPLNTGDPNGDCAINVGDAVYIVNHVFRGGPAPLCGCADGMYACCPNDDASGSSYKTAPVAMTAVYDGQKTMITVTSPEDIYGLQIEVKGDNGAAVVNQVEQTQLYHQWNNGAATVGILDINGVGRIPAGETTILTIAGEATVLSALGADAQGRTFEITVGEAAKTGALPSQFGLHQNRPNPFNPTTEIAFSLPSATDVTLEVYNVTGQRIATLVSGHLEAGNHTVVWNGKDEDDRTVSSGIYLYRIKAGEFAETKKMVLLK